MAEELKNKKTKNKMKVLDVVYIGMFAALISACAQIAIPMTVSFTLQTFAVCLCASLLGAKRGTISVVIYILIGMVGLPVFTGFKSGVAAVTGPTGGYIVGFIFTALIVGLITDKLGTKILTLVIAMTVGLVACYLFGTIWFMIAYHVSFISALTTCVFPFLLPEVAKIALATLLTNRLKKFIK